MNGLFELARESGLPEKMRAMFAGEKINNTENRAALHIALRNRADTPIYVDGENVMPKVNSVLRHMGRFGRAIPGKPSPTSSISASAVPTKAR